MRTYFITGTDTDVGKTVAGVLLLKELAKLNDQTLGIKPISAGCDTNVEGLRNQDALDLQAASGIQANYDIINPIAYPEFIAPHIAAAKRGENISLSALQDCLEKARMLNPRWLLVEGAGGWRLPLNTKGSFYSDFALQNQMKVILVVGMKLGCLNHAVLSYQAIKADGLDCVGYIVNQVDPNMSHYQENVDDLDALLPCQKLADIPYQETGNKVMNVSEHFLQVFR